jgi:hypothetical protein
LIVGHSGLNALGRQAIYTQMVAMRRFRPLGGAYAGPSGRLTER